MGLKAIALTAVDSFTTALYPPSPGSPVQAADVEAGEQVLLNRTLWLKNRANQTERKQNTSIPVPTGGAAQETFTTMAFVSSVLTIVNFTLAAVGDVVECWYKADFQGTAVASDYSIRIASIQDYGGAAVTAQVPGCLYYTRESTARIQVMMLGSFTVTTAGPLRLVLQAMAGEGGATLSCYGTGALLALRNGAST